MQDVSHTMLISKGVDVKEERLPFIWLVSVHNMDGSADYYDCASDHVRFKNIYNMVGDYNTNIDQ